MSVYIKDMEMPTKKHTCSFYNHNLCGIPGRKIEMCGFATETCPLVPVPPHGRLIEADYITDQILSGCDDYTGFNIRDMVDEAPTIIPADKEAGDGAEQ